MRAPPIHELADSVRELLAAGSKEEIDRLIGLLQPWDAARLVTSLVREEQKQLLSLLGPDTAADVVEEMDDPKAAEVLAELPVERVSNILGEMESDEEADLLQTLPLEKSRELLERMPEHDRKEAEELIAYSPESAGGIMMKEFIAIPHDRTVGDVVRELRENAQRYSKIRVSYLYVVDVAQRLLGVVSLRDVLLGEETERIENLMIKDAASVPVDMDQEEVAQLFERYHFFALPVVDPRGRIVGVFRHNDALKVLGREATEDMLKFAGVVGGEETHDMPFFRRAGRRLAWLSVNIMLNLVSAAVIWAYEDTLLAVIGLAMFLPIISDMSGCSGNQAVAVSIRELATGRIAPSDFLRVWWAEATVGLFNGWVLGAQLGLVAGFLKCWTIGLIVGVALWVNTAFSLTIGSVVPLVLKRLGKDPALASAPILTTLTDLMGFLLALSMAAQLFPTP